MRDLNKWFEEHCRDFPWRVNRTPYRVWISEVMLQQTRASVVIPYFERWVKLFPDVKSLAHASLEEVIKAWEGLGYYSRARNLHRTALEIVKKFGGKFPESQKELETLPGFGPYTASAVLCFAFKKRVAAVDGNVTRVLARFFALKEDVSKAFVKKKIQKVAEALLDSEEPWTSSEAFIELGATICTPKPCCKICPLKKICLGREIAETLPIKKTKKAPIHINRAVVVIQAFDQILLKKGESGRVMADLYEFPYFEMGTKIWESKQLLKAIEEKLHLQLQKPQKLNQITHSFTKYKAHLFPYRFFLDSPRKINGYEWISCKTINKLPFSAGHKRILML